jgi:hypothetical protein
MRCMAGFLLHSAAVMRSRMGLWGATRAPWELYDITIYDDICIEEYY